MKKGTGGDFLKTREKELLGFFADGVPIARTFKMRLEFDENHGAVVTLPYNPDYDHGLGGIHGGVYMTLLDTAAWFTTAVTREADTVIATSEMSIHFFRPTSGIDLTAVGKILKRGRRQDIVEVFLYGNGEAVGHAVGTFIVIPGGGESG